MLTINPAAVRAGFDKTPGSATASSPSGDPAGFASLLRQTHAAPAPPAPPETKATAEPPPNDAQDASPAPQESDTASQARALKGKPRPNGGAPLPVRDAKPAPHPPRTPNDASTSKTADDDCKAPETRLKTGEAPIDPSVMHWLAGLQRAAAGQADDAKANAGDATGPADTDSDTIESRGAAKGSRTADLKAEAELKAEAAQGKAQLVDAADARPFVAALTEHGKVVDKPQVTLVDRVKESAAAGASALSPTRTAGTDAPIPVAVAIAAPVTGADFAQELGLRMSVLAKDGVQTAELHLNPADMGPVSVQIVMDGTQARVDFGADIAATRHAIEAGLPELASALRDAGFTLAGGGVSQHAGGRSGGNEPGSPQGRRTRGVADDDGVTRVASAARRIVRSGGVDLFA